MNRMNTFPNPMPRWQTCLLALAVFGVWSGTGARADDFEAFNGSFTTSLIEAPSLSHTFEIPKWSDAPSSLTSVTIALTAELRYEGTLVSVLASQSFNLQVSGDFTFLLDGAPLASGLDPLAAFAGTSPGSVLTPFSVPSSGQLTDTKNGSFFPAIAQFLGGGTIPLEVMGALNASGPVGYHNLTDVGTASPFVFASNAKVFSMEQMQLFQLHTTVVVTYAVPEASTWAAGLLLGAAAFFGWRRRRNAPLPKP